MQASWWRKQGNKLRTQKRKLNTDDKASKEKKRKGFEKKKYCKWKMQWLRENTEKMASDSCQSPVDWTTPSKNTGAERQGQEMDYIYKQTSKSSNPYHKHPGPWTWVRATLGIHGTERAEMKLKMQKVNKTVVENSPNLSKKEMSKNRSHWEIGTTQGEYFPWCIIVQMTKVTKQRGRIKNWKRKC